MKPVYNTEDRFKLCLFNFVNGFDNSIFLQYATAKGALRDKAATQDIIKISSILERGEKYLNDWYSYCLVENKWVYLNGRTKRY